MSNRVARAIDPRLAALCAGVLATIWPIAPAVAGPPYETDDPVPTDLGYWEIYTFTKLEGRKGNFDGSAGVDLNYGPVEGVQLTATLPLEYAHDNSAGWSSGAGDVELGVKYRFLDSPGTEVSMAIFPRVIFQTSTTAGASNRTRLLLPVWAQKDVGKTAIFGGGGYEINPGLGNRDFWVAGVAITRAVNDQLSLGSEVTHQSADTVGGSDSNSMGLGATVKLRDPFSLLVSGGPTWSGGTTSYHVYAALGLNL